MEERDEELEGKAATCYASWDSEGCTWHVAKARALRRPKKNWDKLEHELKVEEKEEKLEGEAALHKLFRDIYGNADEDTRRAMNKSFQARNPGMVTVSPSACFHAGLAFAEQDNCPVRCPYLSGVCGMCVGRGSAEARWISKLLLSCPAAGMPCNALKAVRSVRGCLITSSGAWRHFDSRLVAHTTTFWK